MITVTSEACPICGAEQPDMNTLVAHVIEHATPTTAPDLNLIRADLPHDSAEADEVLFEVEHLIAREWWPETQGMTVNVPLNGYVAESWPQVLGILGLGALDRLLAIRAEDTASREVDYLRVEVKISPGWTDPPEPSAFQEDMTAARMRDGE